MVEVGCEQSGDAVRSPRGEQVNDGSFVRQQWNVGFEPDAATRCRQSQHRRPRPDVRLLGGTGWLKAQLLESPIEPALDAGKPASIGPAVHRPSVLAVPWASIRECPPKWSRTPAVAGASGVREDAVMDEEIRYVRNGGVAIAYQVVGEGEVDLVYVPDFMSNLVYGWESPRWRVFYERLARSFRLILFDKRGTGLSDHGPQFAALETRMEDLRAVLDAAGAANAVVLAAQEGCAMSALYAASYPEHTRALALFHPKRGSDDRALLKELSELRERWGTQQYSDWLLEWGCPTLYSSEEDRRSYANWLRVGASPAAAYALNRAWSETDLT